MTKDLIEAIKCNLEEFPKSAKANIELNESLTDAVKGFFKDSEPKPSPEEPFIKESQSKKPDLQK
jgi:hypothetical protein